MKPLVLALTKEPDQRLDLSPLVPHLIEGKSEAEIAAIEVQTTREKLTVGDIFKIEGGSAQKLRFEGGSMRFDNIGENLKSGEIIVEGDCGKAVGRHMSGGSLVVDRQCRPLRRLQPLRRKARNQGRRRRLPWRSARR